MSLSRQGLQVEASCDQPREDPGPRGLTEASNRAEPLAGAGNYETEARRFESCRARSPKAGDPAQRCVVLRRRQNLPSFQMDRDHE